MPPMAFRANSAALLEKPMSMRDWMVAEGGGEAGLLALTLLFCLELLRSREVTEPGGGGCSNCWA